jgi:tetratricopeptide (TPR) repeat protein
MTLFNVSVQQATPPSRPDRVSFRLSMLYQRRGEVDAAQRHLHYMLKELPPGPLRPSALILLGQTHEREGELAEARRFYERAARTASSERGLALYLATWAAKTAGDAAAASSLAERALGAATGLLRDAVRRDWCALHGDR